MKEYHHRNRERILEYQKKRREAKHEEYVEKTRQWRNENRERTRELTKLQMRRWRAQNPEKAREHVRRSVAKWRQNHPEYQTLYLRAHPELVSQHNNARRARKNNAISTLTLAQWQAIKLAYNNCCAYCGKKMKRLSQDHVIPLSKGGTHTSENVVPACISCNSHKCANAPIFIPPIRLML
jgi:hypothetical protein